MYGHCEMSIVMKYLRQYLLKSSLLDRMETEFQFFRVGIFMKETETEFTRPKRLYVLLNDILSYPILSCLGTVSHLPYAVRAACETHVERREIFGE
jgi:hypothetical protein